ncbi:MAG: hypothetical protein EBY30_18760, partial [Rhodospirillales bacterium]|nr:hypothetical protein [Rhodospirillales bacterium]
MQPVDDLSPPDDHDDDALPEARGERIAKWLARAGIASRRDAEKLITEGRVKLGGTLIQHIPDSIANALPHEQPNPRDQPGHAIA